MASTNRIGLGHREDGGSGEGEPLIQLDFQAWLRVAIEQ